MMNLASEVYVEHDIELALSKERERMLLFNIEEQLVSFMQNPKMNKEEILINDRYHRKLVHSLAKRFSLKTTTEKIGDPKGRNCDHIIIFEKSEETKMPILKLSDMVDFNNRRQENFEKQKVYNEDTNAFSPSTSTQIRYEQETSNRQPYYIRKDFQYQNYPNIVNYQQTISANNNGLSNSAFTRDTYNNQFPSDLNIRAKEFIPKTNKGKRDNYNTYNPYNQQTYNTSSNISSSLFSSEREIYTNNSHDDEKTQLEWRREVNTKSEQDSQLRSSKYNNVNYNAKKGKNNHQITKHSNRVCYGYGDSQQGIKSGGSSGANSKSNMSSNKELTGKETRQVKEFKAEPTVRDDSALFTEDCSGRESLNVDNVVKSTKMNEVINSSSCVNMGNKKPNIRGRGKMMWTTKSEMEYAKNSKNEGEISKGSNEVVTSQVINNKTESKAEPHDEINDPNESKNLKQQEPVTSVISSVSQIYDNESNNHSDFEANSVSSSENNRKMKFIAGGSYMYKKLSNSHNSIKDASKFTNAPSNEIVLLKVDHIVEVYDIKPKEKSETDQLSVINRFMADNGFTNGISYRKISNNSHLIVCSNANEANRVLSLKSETFKLRPLKESSKEVKEKIQDANLKNKVSCNIPAFQRMIKSHLFSNTNSNAKPNENM